MSDLKNLIERNLRKAIIVTGISLLIMGVSLWLYANSVIQGHQRILKNVNLTLEETWTYEGSLQWWKTAHTATFHPLTIILITTGLVILSSVPWSIIQERRVLRTFSKDLVRASKENSRRHTQRLHSHSN